VLQASSSSLSGSEPMNPIDRPENMDAREAIWKKFREEVTRRLERSRAHTHTHIYARTQHARTHARTHARVHAHPRHRVHIRLRRSVPLTRPPPSHTSPSRSSPLLPSPPTPRRTTPPLSRTSAGKRTKPKSKTTRTSWPQPSRTSTPNGLSRRRGACFSISLGDLALERGLV